MAKIVLFGCGKVGKEALDFFGREQVIGFCDNFYKEREYEGIPVICADELYKFAEKSYRLVIAIRDYGAVKDIRKQLVELGIPFTLFDDEKLTQGSNRDIFTRIYREKSWGGSIDDVYYSGPGSHDDDIISPYISMFTDLLKNNDIRSIAEIGCGDFYIMKKILLAFPYIDYIGMDVVEELIDYNNRRMSSSKIRFIKGDACAESVYIPKADLVVIRQVLQHLNNECIMKILDKTQSFKYVLITEHICDDVDCIYNLDKAVGQNIRLLNGSGVYIEKPPFSLNNVVHLLSVPCNQGVIRSSLVINSNCLP